MPSIMLGCDFSQEHTDAILALVKDTLENDTPAIISGVYGSPAGANPFGSVRPLKRETESITADFACRAMQLKEVGVEINLTINSLYPYLKNAATHCNIFDSKQAQEEFWLFLQRIEPVVDNLIIAHPYLLELLHSGKMGVSFGIIISTIMNVHTLPQMMWIRDNWPLVRRVCPALWKNRQFSWLTQAQKILPLELLANEFCSIGGVECEGLYRQACYLAQSTEIKDWSPLNTVCIASRDASPEAWLMARFILPQWMKFYEERTGVHNFKITGRTHDAAYICAVGHMYTHCDADCNLLDLWGLHTATLNQEKWAIEQQQATKRWNIPTRKIEHLIDNFTNCNPDMCGVLCERCKQTVNHVLGR